MTEIYTTNADYVDIHGRNLSVLIKSDGTIFIPLNDIRKTGFHIFPKSDYVRSTVGKSALLDELRLFLLGAAREFLIQRDVSVIKNEDINKSIEECRELLTNNGPSPKLNHSPSGVLGRTLLQNPAELIRSNKSPSLPAQPQLNRSDNFVNQTNRRSNTRLSDPVNSLRMPHQNDNPKPTNYELDNSQKIQNSFGQKRKQYNHLDKSNQNENNRSNQSNNYNSTTRNHRNNSESRSTSENEESVQFIMLSNLTLKRIELQPVMQDIKVVHIEVNNDKLKYWVQLVENEQLVVDIIEKCMEVGHSAPVVKPKMDEIYLAQNKEDELWYRAIVVRVTPMVKVHFLDFGNDAVVTEVRAIPDDLKAIPAQAVRIVVSRPEGSNQVVLEMDEVVTVKKIKQFVDTTYLVQRGNNKINAPPSQNQSERILIDEIKYSRNMLDKDIVKIISHSDGKLYLRNKEHHSKLVDVDKEIINMSKQVINDVVPNQLVLSKKEGSEEKLCRAIVKKVEGGFAVVHFMDYHKDEKVSMKNIFGVNRAIANMPPTLIEIPLKGYSSTKFNSTVAAMLEEMIMTNVKFSVAKNGSDFDLLLKDKPLSEILFTNSGNTKPIQESNAVAGPSSDKGKVGKSDDKYVKVMFDDMKCYEAPMGKGDYMLTNYKDATEFTVTSTNDRESDMLSRCTGIEVNDKEPYEPDDTEMILAFFEGDWYRALVLEKMENGIYQILFVEYGNIIEVTKNEIRRFPKELKDIPMLGLLCQLKVKNTEAVKNRLEQLFEPDNIYEINFLSYSMETLQYTVEIPKITEILVQEGLI
ncbi:uncharacterized protein LOC123307802 [Coccinella septempunctata]|uniref:uncharacterized protein LOC123307802 n=1 Tax=Coccinella septempunctata TaxID=41139 RepID=UPI001D07047C|nr:uncharacterized protein LOC123307802 [Coccinella septempunctata]